MTDILGLTTTDKVRAIWGVTQSELSDAMLVALDLEDLLTLELTVLTLDHATIKTEGTVGTPTTAQITPWLLLKRFSACFCAVQATSSIRLAIPQKRSDGNNAFSRFQGDILEQTCADVSSAYLAAKSDLLDEAGLTPVAASLLATATEPSYDPVVGE